MLLKDLTDKDLISSYLDGQTSSFEVLLDRHKNRVFSFIISKIKDKDLAEDIFQDTFIKVINSLQKGKYNEEGKFLPWILRISHNLVIDHFRKESKMRSIRPTDNFDIFDVIENKEVNQEQKMIKDQIQTDLKILIQQLPEDQRQVLMLRYFEDMSFKKIADLTKVSINTALGRMRYALINLRKLSVEHDIDLQLK